MASHRTSIECTRNGPYLVRGLERLEGLREGERHATRTVTALCRCGRSGNKPYCDGTHSRIGFRDDKSDDREPDRRLSYEGRGVTIHDNRGICAHAGFCTDALPSVFRSGEDPWIDGGGAEPERIVEVVRRCPSGALSYSRDGVEHREWGGESRIIVVPGGPYAVKGGAELAGASFGDGATTDHFDLCRCGQSRNKPFCDGSHWDVSFDEGAPPQESM